MSRSFKCNLTLAFTAVLDGDAEKQVEAMVEATRKALAEGEDTVQVPQLAKLTVDTYDKSGIEGVCKLILANAAKEMRDTLMREEGGEVLRKWAPAHLTVVAKGTPPSHQSEPTAFLDKRFNAVN